MMVMHEENSNIKQYINKKMKDHHCLSILHDLCMHDNNNKKKDFVELIWTQIFSFNTKNISNGLIKKRILMTNDDTKKYA